MSPRNLLLLVLLLSLAAAPLGAQPGWATATRAPDGYVFTRSTPGGGTMTSLTLGAGEAIRRMNAGGDEESGRAVRRLIGSRRLLGDAVADSVADALKAFAVSHPMENVRFSATRILIFYGDDLPERGALYERIYFETPSTMSRHAVLAWAQNLADTAGAVRFYVRVARSVERPDDPEDPASKALGALARMGEPGRAALQMLGRDGTIRDPRARHTFDRLRAQGFREP